MDRTPESSGIDTEYYVRAPGSYELARDVTPGRMAVRSLKERSPMHPAEEPTRMRSAAKIAMGIFGAIALVYLVTGHRAHLLRALPFLFILACLLMHLFMHGKHHHDHDRR